MFDRLIGRNVARFVSAELDLAGLKTTANRFIGIAIVGFIVITVLGSFTSVIGYGVEPVLAFVIGAALGVLFEVMLYSYLELKIDQRRQFVEAVLPDYLQLTSANMRSGVTLSRAMVMAIRPEFRYFGDDINIVGRQIYSGDTMQNAFVRLADKYRSVTLKRTVRIIIEANQYGGGMADLLNQIAKDLRGQQIIQKEVSGQLFMYTIFIAFAALAGAPTLYGLTNQMIMVTSKVWSHISPVTLSGAQGFGGSFIKLSAPQITPSAYYIFSIFSVVMITGFGAFIISAISSGKAIRGVRWLPIFILAGMAIFFIVGAVMGSLFSSFGTA